MKHIYLLTLVASLLVGCSDGGSTAPSNTPSTDSEHVITLNSNDCVQDNLGKRCEGVLDVFPSYIECAIKYERSTYASQNAAVLTNVVESVAVRVIDNGDLIVFHSASDATITCVYRD